MRVTPTRSLWHGPAMKRLTLIVSLLSTLTAATLLATPGQAATRPHPASLEVYEGSGESMATDLGAPGPSDGDERFHHGPLSRTPDGKVIGEFFMLNTTLRTDTIDGLEWREITKEFILPGGTILVQGLNRDVIGQKPKAGQVTHLVITGGTGTYRGARGEMIGLVLQESPWMKKDQFLFVW